MFPQEEAAFDPADLLSAGGGDMNDVLTLPDKPSLDDPESDYSDLESEISASGSNVKCKATKSPPTAGVKRKKSTPAKPGGKKRQHTISPEASETEHMDESSGILEVNSASQIINLCPKAKGGGWDEKKKFFRPRHIPVTGNEYQIGK